MFVCYTDPLNKVVSTDTICVKTYLDRTFPTNCKLLARVRFIVKCLSLLEKTFQLLNLESNDELTRIKSNFVKRNTYLLRFGDFVSFEVCTEDFFHRFVFFGRKMSLRPPIPLYSSSQCLLLHTISFILNEGVASLIFVVMYNLLQRGHHLKQRY